jgi:hypothetical protein
MSTNGRLAASELTTIENGLQLANKTAVAWGNLKAAAKAAGIDIWIALPIGAYRSYFVQGDMAIHPLLYGLSTDSTVRVAAAGYSTHGLGNTVDIGSFPPANNLYKYGTDGLKRRNWLIENGPKFGFFREFGEADPNHFHHDGFTATEPILSGASAGGTKPVVVTTPPPAPQILQENDMIRIQSPGRGIAMIGPGYFKSLTPEEVTATDVEEVDKDGKPTGKKFYSAHINGNDRQFDLWVSVALNGAVPAISFPEQVNVGALIAFTPKEILPGWNFLIGPGYIKNAPVDEANQYAALTNSKVHELDGDWTRKVLWNNGLGEFIDGTDEQLLTFLQSLSDGKFVTATWLK